MMDENSKIHQPPYDLVWEKNNTKSWPKVMYEDLVDYLIHSNAYDGKQMKAFRAMYGYNYVTNGWIGDIYCAFDAEKHYLKATISPSQPGTGRKDYDTKITILGNGSIETGHCSCPAGNGRSCSHIAALIYTISLYWKHGIGGETCTDKEVTWGKGASKALNLERLDDIDFSKPAATSAPVLKQRQQIVSESVTRPKQFLDHKDVEQHVAESNMRDLWLCKGTMLCNILNAPPNRVTETKPIVHKQHTCDFSSVVTCPLICDTCDNVFSSFINLNPEKQELLSEKTLGQTSEIWFDARKIRVTASKVNSLPKSARGDPNKVVNNFLYPRFKGCNATRHGQKYEPVARAWFENVTDTTVVSCGFKLHPNECYIGASPDGLIGEDGIIEIKCPTRPLRALINSGTYDIKLKDENPFLCPRGKNGYYCQVQMTMFVTRRKFCKFVVWTKDHAVIVDVKYDENFVHSILPRIRKFFFLHLLVKVTEELHFKRLKLSTEYRKLCA